MRDKALEAAIATARFGLGASPGEIAAARGDPRGFLTSQITPAGAEIPSPAPARSPERMSLFHDYQQEQKEARAAGQGRDAQVKDSAKAIRDVAGADFLARVRLAAATTASFRERWALFWANHFTVSANKLPTAGLVGPFEVEAIRPHVFGAFESLLVASSSHPGMLLYLDQTQSIGPNSSAAQNAARNGRRVGLNENLAREIMELHTVGVEAGYRQADVTEFARAMTGWSVGGVDAPPPAQGRFVFRERAHEPGARTIMGRRYGADGQGQALAVLKDLAHDPATARHVARKLAAHFVADDPPSPLTARLERSFTTSHGDLAEVARTLVNSPEAWRPQAAKFKSPYEFLVSAWRAQGTAPDRIGEVARVLVGMGQKPFSAPSPKGWPDTAGDWLAPDAIVKRMAWSERQPAAQRDPVQLAQAALGPRLTPAVATAIAHAETRSEAFAILLMSPEFQRR